MVLENYKGQSKESSDPEQNHWVQEVSKTEGHVSPNSDVEMKVPSWRVIINDRGQLNVSE